MTDKVRDSYDAMADLYTALALGPLGDLNRVPTDRERLAAFAELAGERVGPVADLGCGPGHIVGHLSELGLTAVGYDFSHELIGRARQAFPDFEFHVNDLTTLDLPESSLGGIVARYSLIHMAPHCFGAVFDHWLTLLEANGPVLVSFFAAPSAEAHGANFDHKVETAYMLFPDSVAQVLEDCGFDRIEITMRSPIEGERLLEHGTVLAQKPNV